MPSTGMGRSGNPDTSLVGLVAQRILRAKPPASIIVTRVSGAHGGSGRRILVEAVLSTLEALDKDGIAVRV